MALTIRGREAQTVTAFPFSATIGGGEKLTVSKTGALPVYFTAYAQHWNPAPQPLRSDFTVRSLFETSKGETAWLKAGEPVTMKVNVTVKADADYVMIEVPIPAGCSYGSKPQSGGNEVHREYFKNKVSIFCGTLPKGNYSFSVALLPRYAGSYHLNPARAELMYFPVFSGREGMKKVTIR